MFSEKHGNILHGILLIALFSCAASTWPTRSRHAVSRSARSFWAFCSECSMPTACATICPKRGAGILFCSKQLLRAGIVLYGFRDLPERGGHRRAGHRHRRSGGRGDAPAGRIAGPCAENGPRPGAADLDGQRHLRRGGRAGRRTRREGRAAPRRQWRSRP